MAEAPNVPTMSESNPTSTVSIASVPVTAVSVTAVSPAPTDDEVVAIMAGVEALWPTPMIVDDAAPERSTAWRFSGRWWAKPVSARRDRPFR